MIQAEESDLIPGASIVADMKAREFFVSDLLYFLLAHSDISAQATLESLLVSDDVDRIASSLNLEKYSYAPISRPYQEVGESVSVITPREAHKLFNALWK